MKNEFSTKSSWKVWVETANKKLHVHGEIYVADKSLLYQLDKQDPQGYFDDELMLVIKPKFTVGNEKVEVKYHEQLAKPNAYRKVTISSDNETVTEINNIEQK